MSTSISKIVAERNQRILLELVLKPGNDVCADCKARAPRWASHNLGIFICVNCASIHRKIGTHITKVKSITLDQWSKEQVEVMKEMGNIKSNTLYNPNEARHPPPTNMVGSERDSELEKFIRSKYEFKRFMGRKSLSIASTVPRPRSTPLTDSLKIVRASSPGPPPPPKTPENMPPRFLLSSTMPLLSRSEPLATRSLSQPLPPLTNSDKLTGVTPLKSSATTQSLIQKPTNQVWEDLVSLQGPSQSSSLPLQYSAVGPTAPFPSQMQTTPGSAPNPFMNLSLSQASTTAPPIANISVPTLGPVHHVGGTNPFSHSPLLPFAAPSAGATTFPTSSHPFSSPVFMAISAPTTPSIQPVMALPTGVPMPPFPYVPPQTFMPSPAVPFPSAPLAASAAPAVVGLAQNPYTPVGTPGQMAFSVGSTTNPFSTMQMAQVGFPRMTSPTPFGTTPPLGQQETQQLHPQPQLQQQLGSTHGFGGWAMQGAQGML